MAPLSSLCHLRTLDLSGNDIESLEGLSDKVSLQALLLDDNTALWDTNNTKALKNQQIIASLDGLLGLFVQNTGLTDGALNTMLVNGTGAASAPRHPDLFVVGLGRNAALTNLNALAPCTAMAGVFCVGNPLLSDITGLSALQGLSVVVLHNTQVGEIDSLAALRNTSFPNGGDAVLSIRGNPALTAAKASACPDLQIIAENGCIVDRDFTCGSEVLLTVSVSPANAGATDPPAGNYPVKPGESHVLQALQTNPDWVFSAWSGDVVGTESAASLEVPGGATEPMTVTANFTEGGGCTLNMLEPNGAGTVTPAPGEWACRLNLPRQITATPYPGWAFSQWMDELGGEISADAAMAVNMDGDKTVQAEFLPAQWTLVVNQAVGGDTSPAAGVYYCLDDDTVTLTASPLFGWHFDHWVEFGQGCGNGFTATGSPATVTVNCDKVISAAFAGDAVPFADENLRQAVRDAIAMPTGTICTSDLLASGVTVLDTEGYQITSLEGLQYWANLTELRVNNAVLETGRLDLAPLAGLQNLQVLMLENVRPGTAEPATTIEPLASLRALTTLTLRDCGLTGIAPLASMIGLQHLDLAQNRIEDLGPLQRLIGLNSLDLSYNADPLGTDPAFPAVAPLDGLFHLAGLTQLQQLGLSDNRLADVAPLAANTGLGTGDIVDLSNNPLSHASLCGAVRALEARAACVYHEGECRFALTVVALGEGTVTKDLDQGDYAPGDTVLLTATNAPHWSFLRWVADASITTDNTLSVVMDDDKTVTAEFVLDRFPVNVTVTGSGTVTVRDAADRPVGGPVDYGTTVTLEVHPAPGWHFAGWAGTHGAEVQNGTLLVDGAKVLAALFEADAHTLTRAATPEAGGTLEVYRNGSTTPLTPVGNVYAVYTDDEIRIVATPTMDDATGTYYRFDTWTGLPGAVTGPEASFTVAGDMAVTGSFTQQFKVALTVTGQGMVRFTGFPENTLLAQVRCNGASITQDVFFDTHVFWNGANMAHSLLAQAVLDDQIGWKHAGWNWNDEPWGSGAPLLIPANATLEAIFTREHELTLAVEPLCIDAAHPDTPPGVASAVCDPEAGAAWDCTHVILTARATENMWRFSKWTASGNFVRRDRTISLPLDDDRTVAAHFHKFYLPDDLNALAVYLGWQTSRIAACDAGTCSIPDVISMAVLDAIMTDPSAPLHQAALDAYQNNYDVLLAWFTGLELAASPLYERPEDAVISALAASAVYSMESFASFFDTFGGAERDKYPEIAGFLENNWDSPAFGEGEGQLRFVPQMAPCQDVDGDGYSNEEEWLYFRWKYPVFYSMMQSMQNWSGALTEWGVNLFDMPAIPMSSADALPVFEATDTGAPPTVQVTIAKEGEGSTSPPVGTYVRSKYKLTSWWEKDASGNLVARPESSMTEADFATLAVNAWATDDGAFEMWRGGPVMIPGALPQTLQEQMLQACGADPNPTKTLLLAADYKVTAVFKNRPGMQGMNLAADVAWLLEDAAEATQEDFDDLSCDTGELTFDENGDWLYTANGIPDAAEVALLEAILQDPANEQAFRGGASHEYVWRDYAGNLDLARDQLPAQEDYVHRAVAALLTLGDLGHAFHAADLVKTAFGVNLDLDDQRTTAYRWLGVKNDANADGISNLDAWKTAAEGFYDGTATAEDAVYGFVEAASGAEAVFAAQSTAPEGPYPSVQASTTAEDCGCWNDGCVNPVQLEVASAYGPAIGFIAAIGNIESPEECAPLNPNAPSGALVQPGRKIKVTASGAGFTEWDAEGTPIDGCTNPQETFVLGGQASITPRVAEAGLRIYYDPDFVSVSASASDGGLEPQEYRHDDLDPPYNEYVSTPNTFVQLNATSSYNVTVTEVLHEGTPEEEEVSRTETFSLVGWHLSGTQYLDSPVTVHGTTARVSLQIVESAEPVYTVVGSPSGTPVTFTDTPIAADGGYLTANKNLDKITETHYLADPNVMPYHSVDYLAWPYPGFTWSYVEIDGQVAGRVGGGWTANTNTTGCADFVPMAKLMVNIAGEGTDPTGVRPECMGYYTVSPAAYYYDPDVPAQGPIPAREGQEVTVSAVPRSGYRFAKWVGTGEATFVPFIPAGPITKSLDDPDDPITCETITLQMHRDRQVTAMFESARKSLVVTGDVKCDPFGPLEAAGALSSMKWEAISTGSPPTAEEILEKIPKCKVFAYNGHGSADCIGLEYSGCLDIPLLGCLCVTTKALCISAIGAVPKSPYVLVYMMSCKAGANWMGWVEAFNYASAFVGFTDYVFNDVAESFDAKFWNKVRSGMNTFQAANAAVGEVDENEELSQKLEPIKKFVGSTVLSGCN